jgi:hypothetical protein
MAVGYSNTAGSHDHSEMLGNIQKEHAKLLLKQLGNLVKQTARPIRLSPSYSNHELLAESRKQRTGPESAGLKFGTTVYYGAESTPRKSTGAFYYAHGGCRSPATAAGNV